MSPRNAPLPRPLRRELARRVGLTPRHAVVAVVDGASWIEARLRQCLPHLQAIILDFFHLSQHVHEAMRGVFGEGAPQARHWAEQLLHTIRHESLAAFDTRLQACLVDHAATAEARAALTRLRQYVSERREMVNYPYFEARGWPIGSGPTESMAGVLTARIKGRGRRWDAPNIDAIMALQALEVNQETPAYWRSQAPPPQDRRLNQMVPGEIVTPFTPGASAITRQAAQYALAPPSRYPPDTALLETSTAQ